MAQYPPVGQGLLIIKISWSQTIRHAHSIGLLSRSDQPEAQTFTWKQTQYLQQKVTHASGGIRTFNPSKRASLTQALDRAVNGIGSVIKWPIKKAQLTWYKLLLCRDMTSIWDFVTCG